MHMHVLARADRTLWREQNACRMQQLRPRKAAVLHEVPALMTSLSLSLSLGRSFLLSLSLSDSRCPSLSLSFSFLLTETFKPLQTRQTHLQSHNTAPVAVLTSILRSYRHAETYGQPHTHTHVIIIKNGRTAARSVKGQHASRTQ